VLDALKKGGGGQGRGGQRKGESESILCRVYQSFGVRSKGDDRSKVKDNVRFSLFTFYLFLTILYIPARCIGGYAHSGEKLEGGRAWVEARVRSAVVVPQVCTVDLDDLQA